MQIKIGQNIELNDGTYKVVGKVKRSWKLEKDGKTYKCTSNMIERIREQNALGIGVDNSFKIGDEVSLNNKTYKIVGRVKRSWKLERNGKFYKATSNKMQKIQNQNGGISGYGSRTPMMDKRVERSRIFYPAVKRPETETELMDALCVLTSELSPENLSCDGELSKTQINQKYYALRREWREIESLLGRRVSDEEAENYWMDNIMKNRR